MSLIKSLRRQAPAVTDADVPPTFLGFCAWAGVRLTPGQAELCRVAYDVAEPVDRGLAAALFGDLPMGRGRPPVVAAVCGARAGKSYVLVALRLVHGMLMRDVSALPPGQRAVAMIIAPRDDMRMEVFRYALGAVMNSPLRHMLHGSPRVDEFTLRRPDGALVSFETGVATMGGTAARGRWFTDFALDECAFFRDSTYKVNDEEIFRSATARVLPGGQVIVASTPWAQTGLLYNLWKDKPEGTLVVHAPTLVLHDSELTRDIVAREEARDPDNAAREYGAKFMTSGTTVFFEPASIDEALTDEPFELEPGDIPGAGADFGFRSDSSALILVALRGETIHVFDGAEERPTEDKPLKPSQTVASFAAKVKASSALYVMADGHERSSIDEHLTEHGLVFAAAPMTTSDSYGRARMLLRQGRIKIHGKQLDFMQRFVQQLREVHGRPTSGGQISISHPRWAKGGHGDIAAAFVLAVWQVSGDAIPAPRPEEGTEQWLAKAKERRRMALVRDQERPAWMPKGQIMDRGARASWRNR